MTNKIENEPLKVGYYKNITPKKVEWLWYPYIAYGKITIIQGDPGDGKSAFALNLASIVSNNGCMPFSEEPIKGGTVFYQNSEDGKEDTICPRLQRCGANLEKIAYIDETDKSLAMDDERLEHVIEETGARLLILDPIQAYFGEDADMNRAGDIRPIMRKIAKMAQRKNCAVILIGHMSKGKNTNSLYRGLGSIDITAAARSVLLIARMEDSPNQRIMAQIKNNLAPMGDSIVFTIQDGTKITWNRKSKLTATQVVNDQVDEPKSKCERAMVVMEEMLSEGEKLSKDIIDECRKLGIGQRTVNEAKAKLGVKSRKAKEGWYWYNGQN